MRRAANRQSSIYLGKDGYWHGRVTVGRKDDGSLDRRHVMSKSKATVITKVRALERLRDELRVPKVGRAWTVERWLLHWLEEISRPSVRDSSYLAYRAAITKHLLPSLGAIRLDRLTPETIEAVYRLMPAFAPAESPQWVRLAGWSAREQDPLHTAYHQGTTTEVRHERFEVNASSSSGGRGMLAPGRFLRLVQGFRRRCSLSPLRVRRSNMPLSTQDVSMFRREGFLRMPGRLDDELIAQLSKFLEQQAARRNDSLVWSDGQMKLYGFVQRAGALGTRLAVHPVLLDALKSLLGPNIVLQLNRHNQAAINGPGEAEPRFHRDILQWSRNIVTAIVYLADATESNGCTRVIPGSQFAPFVGVPQADGGGTWMDEHREFDGLERHMVQVPMARGDVLLADSLMFHSVGPNTSDSYRQSVVLGYRSVDELDPRPLDPTQLLVAGVDFYRGNDRPITRADAN